MKKINYERLKNIHLVGIGGCGVSAIGKILHQMGYHVSGSDLKENSNTIRLRDLGITIYLRHKKSNLRSADLVVVSSSIPDNNPELLSAKAADIPIIKRAQMLSFILKKHKCAIGIAGTHGKTTTTSMISKILLENSLDPTFLIGGETDYVDGNARLGNLQYAVAEADESDGSFLELEPNIGVVTNVEQDHMEYFRNESNLFQHFVDFAEKIKEKNGLLIMSDHPNCTKIFSKIDLKKITYGFSQKETFSARDFEFKEGVSKFSVLYKEKVLGNVALSVPGEQNISNALAAIAIGLEVGIPFESIASVLQTYLSVKRRFQIIGEVDGVMVVDDYAHHPTEVRATLSAARLNYKEQNRRIIAVFQPHRYSRTFWLAEDFAKSFSQADLVVITDIYSAGEAPIPNVSGKMISDKMEDKKNVIFIPKKEKIAEHLLPVLRSNDMVLTLGAGDIFNVGKELLSRLKIRHETSSK